MTAYRYFIVLIIQYRKQHPINCIVNLAQFIHTEQRHLNRLQHAIFIIH